VSASIDTMLIQDQMKPRTFAILIPPSQTYEGGSGRDAGLR